MKRHIVIFIGCLCIFLLTSCSNTKPADQKTTEIIVSAAASLSEALEEISTDFEIEHPNIAVTLNLGGSGKLAQQIHHGAPADVFLSANQKWMDVLEDQNLILNDTRIDFAKNKLVMIGPAGTDLDLTSFTDITSDVGQIAIGDPKSVPAGNYAKEALEHLGMWDTLHNQFVYAKDVTQVLTYVESGNTAIGFVYQSDLLRADNVEILAEAETDWYTPIVYPAAVTSTSEHHQAAEDFVEFLQTEDVQEELMKYGFSGN